VQKEVDLLINIKPLILKELEKCNIPVFIFYPEDWSSLPCISYYESNNSEEESYETNEYCNISYQIDIWATKSSDCSTYALQVDSLMRTMGFKREFAADMFTDGTYHKTMRYAAMVDTNLSVYQE
jgi:hypothetical protein